MAARASGIYAVALAWVILSLGAGAARSQRQAPSGTGTQSILLLHPADPSYNQALDGNFAGIRGVEGFSQIEPLLAIIENESAKPVMGYEIDWSVEKAGSTTQLASLTVLQQPTAQSPLVGQTVELKPGEKQLVSPFFNWSSEQFPAMLQQGVVKLLFQTSLTNSLITQVQASQMVKVSLDGAIFNDGSFAGTDRMRFLEQFQAEQQAEKDEADWVMGQVSHGADQLTLGSALQQQIVKLRPSPNDTQPSLYDAALRSQASRFYEELRDKGARAVADTARKMSDAKTLTLPR